MTNVTVALLPCGPASCQRGREHARCLSASCLRRLTAYAFLRVRRDASQLRTASCLR